MSSDFLLRMTARRGAVILCFHRISPTDFRARLEPLLGAFTLVSLDELAARRERGRPLAGLLSVTFDDGWVDSCEPIAALCEAERWPITIYLMTALLGGQARFWFGELSEVLSAAAGRRFALAEEIVDLTGPAFASTKARLVKRLRSLPGRDAIELVDRIREAADVASYVPGHRRFVDREFVSTYAGSDWIAFGSHTVDHQALAVQSEQQVLRQLSESRTRLEEAVGRPVVHFCYPYGYPEWIGDAAPRLAPRYYRSATTMVRGVCTSRSNPCYLPRVSLYECDGAARAFAKIFAAPWL